ncbi:prephenate dehydrogenase [Antarcticibacterium arcticum]|uniref:Prephenate dehydrogenase n=1 Tax=Antarcticibacterium arcticum TaxID=2585771 RepID=A0A5B8YL16_9FLAO|nr:prephenate dehydrogenase [Antarcticibacterium arcticum]QED37908.1 prephenate dehydrogenase [Antarcticibacterium arcticum]
MKIIITGVGLIGGSFARDLRNLFPQAGILGMDLNPDHLERSVKLGVIDGEAGPEDVAMADLVIIAIPVDAAIKVVPEILEKVKDECLVIDTGSTKFRLCESLKDHSKRRNFLAAHPIAGTEYSGPEAAVTHLYQNKTLIICEVEKTAFKLQERAFEIFRQLGMRIRYMDTRAHDKHIAYVSHLSHISSFMLGKTVLEKEKNERDIFDMAGSGFASTVRLAKSSPAMWTPIFKENRENVLETLTEYIANLSHFQQLLEQNNFEEIYGEMERTNYIKTILKGIN